MVNVDAGNTKSDRLLVYVTGLRPPKTTALLNELVSAEPNVWWVYQHDHRLKPWGFARNLERAVRKLDVAIGSRVREGQVKEVRLIGHSVGGLLVRAAYLRSAGSYSNETADSNPWAPKVTRLVLLGSPNSGYQPMKMNPVLWLLYVIITPFFRYTAEEVKRGGYWITNLRLRWLEHTIALGAMSPIIYNVLGDADDIVKLKDIEDQAFMPNSRKLELRGADHAGLVELDNSADSQSRWRDLKKVIFDPLGKQAAANQRSKAPVYFIEHGIRTDSMDDWISNISDAVMKLPGKPSIVNAHNYGFFSAWQFALPFNRRTNVHSFLVAYGEAAQTHDPNGFQFFGHSNGTFMMGRSMKMVSAVRFRRIMLAGSVLPTDFPWTEYDERRQIGCFDENGQWQQGDVHNDRAAKDGPVGILAAILHGMWPFNQDIGSAGSRGFTNAPIVTDHPLTWKGGHAGALGEHEGYGTRMDQIANFLSGEDPSCEPQKKRPFWFRFVSMFLQAIAWGIVAVMVWGLYSLFGVAAAGWGVEIATVVYVGVAVLLYILFRTF